MGRTSRAVTSALLVLALAAVTVPTAVNVVPALLHHETPAATPAAAQPPTALASVTGVTPLSATAPVPDAAALSKQLQAALSSNAGTFSAYVTDVQTGKQLYSLDGDSPRMPASNLKLLTATAALKVLGPDTRLETSVLTGSTPDSLVLRAGGDAMLATGKSDSTAVMGHAGLATLAQETAAALAKSGVKGPVTISLDDSLFTGPALNPAWDMGDVNAGEVAPIHAMALYAARPAPGDTAGPRPQDASVAVAQAFAAALEQAGVKTQGSITRSTATGTVLASVQSATVAEQVQYLLAESDNYMAEVMGRLVGVKEGGDGSYTGARTAIEHVLTGLGLPLDGVTLMDSCGLAAGDLISAHELVRTVSLMLADAGSAVGQALPGLPVAGVSGTLTHRFGGDDTLPGAGLVRAKTGTLHSVSTLSGYVINAHGRLLAFSIMANKLDGGPASAIPAIDAAAAALAAS